VNPAPPKSARRKSRELALQGLFEWLVSGSDAGAIEAYLHERFPTIKLDAEHFKQLLHGCIEQAGELDALLQPYLDRPTRELSPVEHALLLLGAYELRALVEVPYRVIINEAVELAKVYGGTDGFKYVNGVLDRVAPQLREAETGVRAAPPPPQPRLAPEPAVSTVPVSVKPRSAARPARAPGAPGARESRETAPRRAAPRKERSR
jgi:N utilization substance protein B